MSTNENGREVDSSRMDHICKDCRQPIRNFLNRAQTYLPPMEPAGLVYVPVSDGGMARTMSYVHHQCTGEPVEGHEPETSLTRTEVMEGARDEAYQRWCSKCGASPTEPCMSLAKRKLGTPVKYNAWPHEERYPEGVKPDA